MALYLVSTALVFCGIVTLQIAPNYDRELKNLGKVCVVVGIVLALLPVVMQISL